jgi:hypothetical protein
MTYWPLIDPSEYLQLVHRGKDSLGEGEPRPTEWIQGLENSNLIISEVSLMESVYSNIIKRTQVI